MKPRWPIHDWVTDRWDGWRARVVLYGLFAAVALPVMVAVGLASRGMLMLVVPDGVAQLISLVLMYVTMLIIGNRLFGFLTKAR